MHKLLFRLGLYLFFLSVSISCHIEITDPPIAAFSYVVNQKGAYSEVVFTNNSTNSKTYFWDFGDGTTAADPNPQHLYASGGTYQVKLLAQGIGGNAGITNSVVIKPQSTSPILTLDFSNANDTKEWARQYNTNGNTGEFLTVSGGYLNMRTTGSQNDIVYGLKHSGDLTGLTSFEIVTKFGKEELASGNPRFCHIKFPVKEYGGRDLSLDILYENSVRSLRVTRYGKETIIKPIPTNSCSEITFTVRSVNGKFEVVDNCTNSTWFSDTEITLSGSIGLDIFYTCASGACGSNSYGSFAIDYIYVRKY